MVAVIRCQCGDALIKSRKGDFRICPHCDMPSTHKASGCVKCQRITQLRR